MKRIILLYLLSLFFFQNVLSQDNTRFGVRAGLNFSHMDFSEGSPPPEIPIETNWEPGLVAGFVVVIPVYRNFYFQPEYLFSQMGGELKKLEKKYSFNYLSLPVLLRWEYKSFYLTGGPQFELVINSREKLQNSHSKDDSIIEQRHIGITGGIGYNFFSTFGVEL